MLLFIHTGYTEAQLGYLPSCPPCYTETGIGGATSKLTRLPSIDTPVFMEAQLSLLSQKQRSDKNNTGKGVCGATFDFGQMLRQDVTEIVLDLEEKLKPI